MLLKMIEFRSSSNLMVHLFVNVSQSDFRWIFADWRHAQISQPTIRVIRKKGPSSYFDVEKWRVTSHFSETYPPDNASTLNLPQIKPIYLFRFLRHFRLRFIYWIFQHHLKIPIRNYRSNLDIKWLDIPEAAFWRTYKYPFSVQATTVSTVRMGTVAAIRQTCASITRDSDGPASHSHAWVEILPDLDINSIRQRKQEDLTIQWGFSRRIIPFIPKKLLIKSARHPREYNIFVADVALWMVWRGELYGNNLSLSTASWFRLTSYLTQFFHTDATLHWRES